MTTETLQEELYDAVCKQDKQKFDDLLKLKVRPTQPTMQVAACTLDVLWMEPLLKAGGKATPEMMIAAVASSHWSLVQAYGRHDTKPDELCMMMAMKGGTGSIQALLNAGGEITPALVEFARHNKQKGMVKFLTEKLAGEAEGKISAVYNAKSQNSSARADAADIPTGRAARPKPQRVVPQ